MLALNKRRAFICQHGPGGLSGTRGEASFNWDCEDPGVACWLVARNDAGDISGTQPTYHARAGDEPGPQESWAAGPRKTERAHHTGKINNLYAEVRSGPVVRPDSDYVPLSSW